MGLLLYNCMDYADTSWWLAGGISAANCLAAYQPKGAASYAASKSNLANPGTYDLTEGTAPSWASGSGWSFNGSTQYLTAASVPMSTAMTVVARIITPGSWVDATPVVVSLRNAAFLDLFARHNSFANKARVVQKSGSFYVVNSDTLGALSFATDYVLAARVSANVIAVDIDGSEDTATTGAASMSDTGALGVGNYAAAGGGLYYNGDIYAVAIYDIAITGAQRTALTTAMQAL